MYVWPIIGIGHCWHSLIITVCTFETLPQRLNINELKCSIDLSFELYSVDVAIGDYDLMELK